MTFYEFRRRVNNIKDIFRIKNAELKKRKELSCAISQGG